MSTEVPGAGRDGGAPAPAPSPLTLEPRTLEARGGAGGAAGDRSAGIRRNPMDGDGSSRPSFNPALSSTASSKASLERLLRSRLRELARAQTPDGAHDPLATAKQLKLVRGGACVRGRGGGRGLVALLWLLLLSESALALAWAPPFALLCRGLLFRHPSLHPCVFSVAPGVGQVRGGHQSGLLRDLSLLILHPGSHSGHPGIQAPVSQCAARSRG